MTKVEMINVIEKSNIIINFKRSHFMGKLKEDVERFYKMAIEYMAKTNQEK